jgi:hypothetical protein
VQFGPVETGAPATRTLVLHNDGAFDVEYRFYPRAPAHIYSRVSVHSRAEEREKAEATKASNTRKPSVAAAGQARSALGKPKAPVVITRPEPRPPQPLASGGPGGKPLKDDKKGGKGASAGGITPRSGAPDKAGQASARGDKSSRSNLTSPLSSPLISAQSKLGGGSSGGKKGKGGDVVVLDFPPDLEMGVFKLAQPCGFVAAGSSVEFEVSVLSDVPHVSYSEWVDVEVSGADPAHALTPIHLTADSCTPGIDVHDVARIFEESEVRPELAATRRTSAISSHAKKMCSSSHPYWCTRSHLRKLRPSPPPRTSPMDAPPHRVTAPVRVPATVPQRLHPRQGTSRRVRARRLQRQLLQLLRLHA